MWTLLVFCIGTFISIDAKSIEMKKSSIEFDDIFPSKFGALGFPGTWISTNELTYNANGDLIKLNVQTGRNDVILSKDFINEHSWSGATFRISSDLKKVLVRYAPRQIFRHSTVSKFSIVRLDEKDEYKVADGGEIQIAFFTPNGKGLAFIEENNIHYLDIPDIGIYSTPQKITNDGVTGIVSFDTLECLLIYNSITNC
jgi:dipeptidyl-peptidase 4